jgi:hypothetical protein
MLRQLGTDSPTIQRPCRGFRNDVTTKPSSLKDEIVYKASDTASGTAHRLWSELKPHGVIEGG